MNPETNTLEPLSEATQELLDQLIGQAKELGREEALIRPNGELVPEHWSIYRVGEDVVVKNYTWRVAHIGEKHLLLEPVGPVLVGEESQP